jgi:hypothetical protein
MRGGSCRKNADALGMVARWIAVGLLVAVSWPALIMGVALLHEIVGRRRAER